jgi:hypothetical protein
MRALPARRYETRSHGHLGACCYWRQNGPIFGSRSGGRGVRFSSQFLQCSFATCAGAYCLDVDLALYPKRQLCAAGGRFYGHRAHYRDVISVIDRPLDASPMLTVSFHYTLCGTHLRRIINPHVEPAHVCYGQ